MNTPVLPQLSVIMSVYNGDRFLHEAIASVLGQSFTDFELLILDDGSSDGSRAIIAELAAGDGRIRTIFRDNRGLIASLNQLIAEARAPLIARMDADDVCLPERFARQIDFLGEHPEYGVVGSRCADIDENGLPFPIPPSLHPTSHQGFLEAIAREQPLLCHPAVMYRRAVVLAVGGYHPAFRHCEDLDLWLRLASVTQLCSLPEQLIRYRHYPDQVSSRHATAQQTGAAIARLAYLERRAGRSDPTAHLERLPPVDDLDALFGRPGVARQVRAAVVGELVYSPTGMRDNGFELVLDHLRDGGCNTGMWRTVARLLRFGEPGRAIRLATTLASN